MYDINRTRMTRIGRIFTDLIIPRNACGLLIIQNLESKI